MSNQVRLKDGKVDSVETWVHWNGVPWPTIVIQKEGDIFESEIGDPEHGGGSLRGNLREILAGLHAEVASKYEQLFALENPTPESIAELGFKGYNII